MSSEWGIFKGWVQGLVTEKTTDWTFGRLDVGGMPVEQIPALPVEAESAYLSLFVRSMRIVDVRKLTMKFYAVVHAFTALDHLSGKKAEFHVLTTPGQLQELDPQNIDDVILLNRRMLGPIPYRGGDFDVNLALLSVKSADLAAPYIELLKSISDKAGFTFVNAMLPFAEPLSQGISLLIGAQKGSILQVGVSTTFDTPMTGYYVVMRAPKGTTQLSKLRLDQDYHLIEAGGKPLQNYPYVVFSVGAVQKRGDWFMIPEIAESYKALQSAVRTGKLDSVEEAFAAFKLITLTSPDLLRADARKIVDRVDADLKDLGPQLTAGVPQDIVELGAISL